MSHLQSRASGAEMQGNPAVAFPSPATRGLNPEVADQERTKEPSTASYDSSWRNEEYPKLQHHLVLLLLFDKGGIYATKSAVTVPTN